MTQYEDITVKLEDGRTISWDCREGYSRFASASVCSVANKILNLRKILKDHGEEIPGNVRKKLEVLAGPFSFEDSFLSSDVVKVHEGVSNLGRELIENIVTP